MVDRISSLDAGYTIGDLSIFPEALDDEEILYEAVNNAETMLKQTLSYNGKVIIVDDTSGFTAKGQIRLGPPPGEAGMFELVYYNNKTTNTFQDLKRAFSGSIQNVWPATTTHVTNAVVADHHNGIRDAIINIEEDLGIEEDPATGSLNAILKEQEVRFLTPKPLFRAFPTRGQPLLQVRFQNFTTGHIARYLWDFGDGSSSLEKSPSHTYLTEGFFTVKLNVITSTGAQGIATKINYIEVDDDISIPFFYVESLSNPFSVETASIMTANGTPTEPKEFVFVDQTDGDIVQRNWVFGDGETFTQNDSDIHDVSHIYTSPGVFLITLLNIFSNGRLTRAELTGPLVVL